MDINTRTALAVAWIVLVAQGPVVLGGEPLDGRVIKLDLPDPLPASMQYARTAEFAWTNDDHGQPHKHRLQLLPGTHVYEMRGLPGWEGSLNQAGLAMPVTGVPARLTIVSPTLAQEMEIALRPPHASAHLVNHLDRRPIWTGTALHQVTPVLMIIMLFGARFWKRWAWGRSVCAGIVAAMLPVAVIHGYDRWGMAVEISTGRDQVELFEEIDQFAREANLKLQGHPWTMAEVDRFRKYGVLYEFAESPFTSDLQQAEYLVTMRPQTAPVVQVGSLYLERTQEHK